MKAVPLWRIIGWSTAFCLCGSLGSTQTPPSFSSNLLLPKYLTPQYPRMNSVNSQTEFQMEIFGVPHGISAFVYNDFP